MELSKGKDKKRAAIALEISDDAARGRWFQFKKRVRARKDFEALREKFLPDNPRGVPATGTRPGGQPPD